MLVFQGMVIPGYYGPPGQGPPPEQSHDLYQPARSVFQLHENFFLCVPFPDKPFYPVSVVEIRIARPLQDGKKIRGALCHLLHRIIYRRGSLRILSRPASGIQSFELPVFIFFMAKIGIVNSKMLAKQRRYAILIIFVAAAVLTPSPDAITQIIMAVPLMILYEFSILIAKLAEKKRSKDDAQEEMKNSEEEPS
jgi:hypothetical protein